MALPANLNNNITGFTNSIKQISESFSFKVVLTGIVYATSEWLGRNACLVFTSINSVQGGAFMFTYGMVAQVTNLVAQPVLRSFFEQVMAPADAKKCATKWQLILSNGLGAYAGYSVANGAGGYIIATAGSFTAANALHTVVVTQIFSTAVIFGAVGAGLGCIGLATTAYGTVSTLLG